MGLRLLCYDCQAAEEIFVPPMATKKIWRDENLIKDINEIIGNLPMDIYMHSKNVALLSMLLAKQIGLPEVKVKEISLGGLLHDVGKSRINPTILYKKGRLSESEFKEIKKHCELGAEILNHYKHLHYLLPYVEYHHERWDGLGYYGLKELDIPLGARIICIADAFDAMTSLRPYQDIRRIEEAFKELDRCKGAQFDPLLVKEFSIIMSYLIEHDVKRECV